MLTNQLVPLRTKGKGDCAFHAIFGEWNGKKFQCPNVKSRREAVAALIISAQVGSEIFSNTVEGIRDIVMANRRMGGRRIQALKDQYRTFITNNQNAMDQSWHEFETKLQNYPAIIDYIHQFSHELGTSNANLKTKFDTCFNEGNQLERQILSIPELSTSYDQYRTHTNTDFWHTVTWDEETITEYAQCMQQEGTFTLPTDLDTIARVFQVTIAYHTKKRYLPQAIRRVEDYNPGMSTPPIPIYFNGTNHYERMADSKSVAHVIPCQDDEEIANTEKKIAKIFLNLVNKTSSKYLQRLSINYLQAFNPESLIKTIKDSASCAVVQHFCYLTHRGFSINFDQSEICMVSIDRQFKIAISQTLNRLLRKRRSFFETRYNESETGCCIL